MLNLLQEVLSFISGLIASASDLVVQVFSFVLDVLVILHVQMPRLEGLLIGVGLAWMMSKRDKSPVFKALSAPLKLTLDVLDLALDQITDFSKEVWGVGTSVVKTPFSWAFGKAKGLYDSLMKGLTSVKEKLTKKKD